MEKTIAVVDYVDPSSASAHGQREVELFICPECGEESEVVDQEPLEGEDLDVLTKYKPVASI